jgi:hypothetical protein
MGQFVYSGTVSPTFETGLKENTQAAARHVRIDHASAEAYDIGVIVLPCQSGPTLIMNECSTNVGEPISRHGHADPAAADENASGRPTVPQRSDQCVAKIGIVDSPPIVRPEVDNRVLKSLELRRQKCLQVIASVVTRDCYRDLRH